MISPYKLITAALLWLTLPISAAELSIITLENGAKVRLNDDFTWEYVILTNTQEVPVTSQIPSANAPSTPLNTSTTAIKAAENTAASAVVLSSVKTLTADAMVQAQLLKSTAKNGVKVSVSQIEWDNDGRLGLTFDLASTSPEHYVLVELEVRFFNDNGQEMATETINVWRAINRMPDTYLRKNQQRTSNTFWIEGLNQQQWQQQLLSLRITEMDSRM
ncbi:DUF3157 family protein [Shewanella sp. SNU WT4]|uniref:DUF3157 family protein n=1 Tax=Shewanella sp. SNU WT4 TaxID=2590015 RepID=UPI00112AA0B9|nr:DUF3157 family protein [Shewanella sp. SNU WT4]QDF65605.1 DUF3157 family protein [Shewanella sp. SNU WT4]